MYYGYDNAGNLQTRSDAHGTTSYTYDALHRPLNISYLDSTPNVTLIYYGSGVACRGHLTRISSGVSTTSYTSFDG